MALQAKEASTRVDSTVIGESIVVSGKLEGDEDLTVRGRVYGSIALAKTLIVEPTGVVKADAQVRNAIISGVVVGNITATESVHLSKEGRMVGDISAPRVIIVEGAAFRGRVDMGAAGEIKPGARVVRPQVTPVATRPMSRPVLPPRPPPFAAKPIESKPPPPPPLPPALKPATVAPAAAPAPAPMAVSNKKKVVVKRRK